MFAIIYFFGQISKKISLYLTKKKKKTRPKEKSSNLCLLYLKIKK